MVYEMRLYNIYYLCKELISVFETVEVIDDNSFSPARHYISKWEEYKIALETFTILKYIEDKSDN